MGDAIGGATGKGGDVSAGPMLEYAEKGLDLQKQIYNQNRRDALPWYNTGSAAVGLLGHLLGIETRPTYEQYLPMDAVQRGADKGINEYVSGGAENGSTWQIRDDGLYQQKWKGNTPIGDYVKVDTGTQASYDPSTFGMLTQSFGMDDYLEDPGYQFRLDEGQKALERKLNASGKTYSPEAAKALIDYNSGMASQEYANAYNRYNIDQDNLFNRLATLSGYGQTASQQLANTGTNYANAATDLYTGMGNAVTSAQLANQANNSSMFNTLVGAGAKVGSAYLMSDVRAKENISPYDIKQGFKRYIFNYIGDDTDFIGVMAQEVKETNPEAVIEKNGYLMVNYDKLGFPMEVL